MHFDNENIVNLSEEEISWLDEEIEKIPNNRLLYRIFCFFLRKKNLTYQDLYVIYTKLYSNKKDYKKISIERVGEVYYFNNGRFPLK